MRPYWRIQRRFSPKEELYEAVWEEVYLPGDNTLNAQLSNLRKKIAQLDPDEDYIETVWGLGVRLKGTSNVGIASSSSRSCPSLGTGLPSPASALKDLQEQIQKKLQNGSGVRLTSQCFKKECRLDQAGQ